MRRFRNPCYAPESLERKLSPSGIVAIPVTAEIHTLKVTHVAPKAAPIPTRAVTVVHVSKPVMKACSEPGDPTPTTPPPTGTEPTPTSPIAPPTVPLGPSGGTDQPSS